MTPLLLIDGDILCYKAAWKAQDSIDWEDGEDCQLIADVKIADRYLDRAVATISEALESESIAVCLSDTVNWRKELWPEYKSNRTNQPKPVLLDHCKSYFRRNYRTYSWPRLEADDVMGIRSTYGPESIIVSSDKDMKTVPGKLYNPDHPEDGVVKISHVDAVYWHMFQTLTGDTTDGYKGCPGIGPVKAKAILDNVDRPTNSKQFKEWRKELWTRIEETYSEKGQTKQQALLSARLANILTKGQYNPATAKIKPWKPPVT